MKTTKTLAAAAALLVLAGGDALAGTNVHLDIDGNVSVPSAGLGLTIVEHLKGWQGSGTIRNEKYLFPDANGRLSWSLKHGKNLLSTGRSQLRAEGDAAAFSFSATANEDRPSEGLVLSVRIPVEKYVGGAWSLDTGKSGVLPVEHDDKRIQLVRSQAKAVTLTPKGGAPVRIEMDGPMTFMIQDSRRWGAEFVLRISDGRKGVTKGETRTFSGRIVTADGAEVTVAKPFVVKEETGWTALDYHKDIVAGSALDLSGQGLQDAPAGKHGWLRNVDGHFEFESLPGVKQRFYGVNLCFSANYPDHETADRLIARLVRTGYNTIRVHHYERDLIAGRPCAEMAFKAENIDRLDYLLAKAVENGLYITTDIFVSRPVTWEQIGLADCGKGQIENKNLYKCLVATWDPAFKDWCAFAERFLLHVNPYTGRRYLDEPAMPLISLVNEGQLTMGWTRAAGPARENRVIREAWKTWLAGKRRANPSFCPDAPEDCVKLNTYADNNAAFAQFMADTERASATRMTGFLKKLGSRALFTNANCGPHYAPMQEVREDCYDYVDDHFYVDHPKFLVKPWTLPSAFGNKNPVQSLQLPPTRVAFTRMADKPFTITEWNFSGPGMFRGVGGIMTGAYSALQDWDGLWRFAYSHSRDNLAYGKGSPGYFDVGTDPLGQASDRASVCLFLRRDLAPLTEAETYVVTPEVLHPEGGKAQTVAPPWTAASWHRQVSTAVTRSKLRPGTVARPMAETHVTNAAPFAARENPAFSFDRERGTFSIATARTAGGFTPDGSLTCGPVTFAVKDAPATVWASSVDREPTDICHARRLVVTHLTDVQANGNVYSDERKTVLLKWGKAPPVVRNGSADVALALAQPDAYDVWALETSGRRLQRIPVEVKDGRLCFTVSVKGPNGARMLYEVVRR